MKSFDSKIIRLMVKSASNSIVNCADEINDMNVFPVPDGDTGTNMSLTFSAAAASVDALDSEAPVNVILETLAKVSLRNARGNSGVILSQILRGVWQGIGDCGEVGVSELKNAACGARDTAYRAVMKPAEGTVLTVVREIAEFAEEHFVEFDDVFEFARRLLKAGEDSLARTPEALPALKQAGVVDAGGCGIIILLKGAVEAAESGRPAALREGKGAALPKETKTIETEIKYKYCTEFLINKETARSTAQFMAAIKAKGDCMLVIDDDDIVKVHIHTNHPGYVLEQAVKLGEMTNIKIDNMKYQHNEIIAAEKDSKKDGELKKYGFVSVVSGSGMRDLFKSLDCDEVVEGGQSMNPSAQDILSSVEQVNAENVFILPNNKNIIMAADQVCGLTDKNVIVIPTRDMPQGITAMASFMPEAEPDENIEAMNEASAMVKCGQVTIAARSAKIDGMDIAKGDVIAVAGGSVRFSGSDMQSVAISLAGELVDDDSGVLSLYYGLDADSDEAEAIRDALEDIYPDLDVKMNYGGQDVYPYIIAAE
ncbi:MAG TPA: DAK2 domain-containing protein [Candidatus Monoglobus merdigallinarum]|uniref:DAK2 domain-containing protein n=1 Tax=Candidatus Monoglobus merdigallinarum TaxID=2838698 RepID=A0A9D1PR26_9FIRM|nr:DAK2 domain-containing protein [Candidatus Monoglobus merdigallinarum]